jgi:hypothetical protein
MYHYLLKIGNGRKLIILKMEKAFSEINKLSNHLFWDVDRTALDFRTHNKFIVGRVLEYGLLSDWIIIKNYYGKDEIGRIATSLRSLDRRALSFIATYTGLPEDRFRCYTTRQSTPQHWNF